MATPITDYASLIAAFNEYVERNDLQAYVSRFLQLTESRLNRVLRVRDMEKSAAVTLTSGSGDLPADFLEWIAADWTSANDDPPARTLGLRFVEANSPEATYRFRPSGDPQYFTILAGKVTMRPRRTGALTLSYYGKIPVLTETGPASTNWLLQRAPELYLYGMLAESYAFQKDEPKADAWMKAIEDRLQAFLFEADVQKVGRRPLRAAEDAADNTAQANSR